MTVINAITPSGRHIKAAMNTAAINDADGGCDRHVAIRQAARPNVGC